MKAGFIVKMGWGCSFGDTVIVVTNFTSTNEVINYPFVNYTLAHKIPSDVGMWKIKQLKNQLCKKELEFI